jgi:hypothetical protein
MQSRCFLRSKALLARTLAPLFLLITLFALPTTAYAVPLSTDAASPSAKETALALPGAEIRLEGRLTTGAEPATYTLDGWILLHPDLAPYLDHEVAVTGTPLPQPNIYMRPALQVTSIQVRGTSEPPITLPAFPAPTTEPAVFWGQLLQRDGHFWLETPVSTLPVAGSDSLLSPLVGRPTALLLGPANTDGRQPALEALALDRDILDVLGQSRIFQFPSRPIRLRLWEKPFELERPLILGNSRTLAGLRQISETVGAVVEWNGQARTATFMRGERTVSVTIGSTVAYLWDGKTERSLLLDVAPVILDGRTMVPVRFLAEALGLTVDWDPVTWTIDLR